MNNRPGLWLCWTITVVSAATNLFGQAGPPDFRWGRSGGGTNNQYATDVAVDPQGNSHVIGKIHGNYSTFGSIAATNEGIFVANYDSNGNPLWVNVIGTSGNSQLVFNIATDDAGNTYVGGHFILLKLNFGTTNLTPSNPDGYDLFLAKYDPQGHLAWARTSYSSTSSQIRALGLATDSSGNCYLTGDYTSAEGLGLTNEGFNRFYVAKFDTTGSLIWARPGPVITDIATPHTYPIAIALVPNGGYYLSGEFAVTNITFGNTVLTNLGIYADVFLARYDAAGNVLWARSGGYPAYDSIWGISVDSAGSCYVGAWNQSTAPANFSGCMLTNHGIVKYDKDGNVLWCRSDTFSANARDYRHTTDSSGNVYFTGLFEGVVSMAGMSLTNRGGAAYPSYFLFKLNADGQAVWAKQFGGGDFTGPGIGADIHDIQGGVAVNTAGDCTVVGFLSITNAIFDSFTLTSAGDDDMFLARFEAEPPRLKIAASTGSITVSWPTNQTGFGLERTFSLSPGSQWESVTNAPELVGMENRVTQVTTTNSMYFRLRKL